jgi:cell division protein DivIC
VQPRLVNSGAWAAADSRLKSPLLAKAPPRFIRFFPVNLRRCILALYLVLIGGIGLAAAVFFVEAREEYARLKSIQSENRRLVADAELRLKHQEKVLERLSSDPSYVDKVIRRKLGYARPEEFVFRFSEN